jgi:hypothetical protein
MTTNATAAPSPTAARRYSQQIHVLVEQPTRAVLLGLAALDAEAGGYARLREGEVVRSLLEEAIQRLYETDPRRYNSAVRRGQEILKTREKLAGK